jgi:hypothetical protein
MSGLLNQLAYEEPEERMPYVPGGRDEVNLMAEAVNNIINHRERFISWWKNSMQEADACQRLGEVLKALKKTPVDSEDLKTAQQELLSAIDQRNELLSEQYQRIAKLNSLIIEKAGHILLSEPGRDVEDSLKGILDLAHVINNILDMTNSKIVTVKS